MSVDSVDHIQCRHFKSRTKKPSLTSSGSSIQVNKWNHSKEIGFRRFGRCFFQFVCLFVLFFVCEFRACVFFLSQNGNHIIQSVDPIQINRNAFNVKEKMKKTKCFMNMLLLSLIVNPSEWAQYVQYLSVAAIQ